MLRAKYFEMFYLHVMKTGGQTLATRLASGFDPGKVHMFQDDLAFPEIPQN